MNIGFIYGLSTRAPSVGGSVHGYQLAKGLHNRGHRLYSWYFGENDNPFCEHFRGRDLLSFLAKIDVLYLRAEWSGPIPSLARLHYLRRRRLPVAMEFNGLPEEILFSSGTRRRVHSVVQRLRRLRKHVDLAVAVTTDIRDFVEFELGFRRAVSIPNGTDPAMFVPAERNRGKTDPLQAAWIGSTGAQWHDLTAICQAAEILLEARVAVEIRVFGKKDGLEGRTPGNVSLEGILPYMDIGQHLNRADVGIHLFRNGSRIEGSPLKIFDYMGCGLALLTQDCGQRGQILRDWEAGLATDGTPDDLAEKLRWLEANRDECERLGRNGRRAAETYYNWDRVVRETEEALLGLL